MIPDAMHSDERSVSDEAGRESTEATASAEASETTDATGAPPAVARARRPRVWLRLLVGFVLGLALCAGAAAVALYAWDAQYEGRVLPGVDVGGVDLSGLSRAEAAATLTKAFAGLGAGRIVIRTEAGDVSVPYASFGRRADVEAMVAEALAAGREGTPLERSIGQVRVALSGRSVRPRLAMDEAAAAAGVAEALSWLVRDPIDAVIATGKKGIYTVPARDGRAFDAAAASTAAIEAARHLDAPREVVVEAPSVPVPPSRTDADIAAARAAAERMVGDIRLTSGDDHWTIKAATVRLALRFVYTDDGGEKPVVDPAVIQRALRKVAKAVKQEPVSATYLGGKRGGIVGVAPGRDGVSLDAAATAAALARAIEARGQWIEPAPVSAVLVRTPPKLTTADAVKKAPLMKRLGSWKTWFPVSERNYFGANIWQPAKFIDGTVLYPGQTFEWWRAVGPITSGRGFGLGGYIAGDHTEPTGAIGGGMCSSSTTLFNAALRAGLRMGARSNHRYYINRYPLGLDATVSGGLGRGQTMSFTNDMDTPIVIRSFRYRANGLGWVRYEIWGIPDGRKVSIGRPVVANVRKATTYTVYVSTLPKGVREQVEYPANGMDVAVTRVVRDRNGRVIHRETYRSHYTLWNGRIEVGS